MKRYPLSACKSDNYTFHPNIPEQIPSSLFPSFPDNEWTIQQMCSAFYSGLVFDFFSFYTSGRSTRCKKTVNTYMNFRGYPHELTMSTVKTLHFNALIK